MNKKYLFVLLAVLLSAVQVTFAQSDIEIFGFAQTRLKYQTGTYEVSTTAFGPKAVLLEQKTNYISSSVQQLNLFFRKELSEYTTAWINFEVLNNYSSDRNWGGINLEEAWINIKHSDALNLKVGLLVPRFNHLNEIKNRMPLIPYITRPLIFEPTLKNIATPWNYLPERAFLQVTGNLPVDPLTLDYAVFAGNSETKYANSDPTKITETGSDSVTFKMVGGRFGMKYGSLYAGISATFDAANYQATLKENVARTRFGFDAGGSIGDLFFEGEFINVALSPDNTTKDLDKSFFYGTLGYNFTEALYGYGTYSLMKDKESQAFEKGMNGIILGAGFKPIPSLVVKAEYSTYFTNSDITAQVPSPAGLMSIPATVDVDFKTVQLAVSFLF